MPALVLGAGADEKVLTQSLAIIEYLEETHPEPALLPPDAYGRARVRALALDIACEIHPLDNLRVLRYLVKDMGVSEDDKNRWYRHWVEAGLEVVERRAGEQRVDGALLPWRHARPGRLRARAADLQRPAHGLPARPRTDRDAGVRELHARSGLRHDAAFGLSGRDVNVPAGWLAPGWASPAVGALMTTRAGGVSEGRYASMNLGAAVGDAAERVAVNRARLAAACAAVPVFLRQVHGCRVVRLGADDAQAARQADAMAPLAAHEADASVTSEPGVACVVQAADCLPVLFAAPDGRAVGAAHAGWRGLAAGVLEAAVGAVCEAGQCAPHALEVWLGACIGPRRFEVGSDVLAAFDVDPLAPDTGAFRAARPGKWLADLPRLARARLVAAGITRIAGGDWCTVEDSSRFFSFRRDGVTGRMAAAVWIRDPARR